MPHLRLFSLKIEDTDSVSQPQQPLQTPLNHDNRVTRSGRRYSKPVITKNQIPHILPIKRITRTCKQGDPNTAINPILTHPLIHTQNIKQEENKQPQLTYPHTYLSPFKVKQEDFSPPHKHLIELEDHPSPLSHIKPTIRYT